MPSLRTVSRTIGTLASGAAWVFVVGTLFGLSWTVVHLLRDPSGTTAMISTEVGDRTYTSWGLTYRGTWGLVMAIVQGLVVTAAAASSLPAVRSLRPRRVGHVVLCAWALLWTFNAIRTTSLDHLLFTRSVAIVFCVLAACTVYRALAGWWPGGSEKASAGAA